MHPDDSTRAQRYRERGWWPGESLAARYARTVRERAHATAVIDDQGRRLTHAALWDEARRLAAEYESHGLQAGDVVLIFMPNRAEWQVALLAALQLGAVPANIPIRTGKDTLRYVLELCAVRMVVTTKRHGDTRPGALAEAAARACPRAPAIVMLTGGGWSWSDARTAGHASAPRRYDGLDHVMFTSSTTGRPKAVMHTADTLAALNVTFAERFGLDPETPVFMPSPLGHSVGAIHGARLCLHTGAPLILQDRWDPAQALATVAEHGCEFTAAATPFLKDLVDAEGDGADKLAPLRWFLCGGAQVPPALMERALAAFPHTRITVLWGMTEGGLTTCTRDSPRDKVLHSTGIGLPGLELRTLDARGEVTPPGVEGELAMRGPGVFTGYYGQDSLYESLLTPDRFFRTGDLARIDSNGYVHITGRAKDLIIRGGVNLSPVPIEDALSAHPGVHAVAVIGYPDDRLGERICAAVVANGAAPVDHESLLRFVRERGLPKAMWPELVRTVAELPRTAAGKVRKQDLRARIIAHDRADAGAGTPAPSGAPAS